jgi:hypothetical protein
VDGSIYVMWRRSEQRPWCELRGGPTRRESDLRVALYKVKLFWEYAESCTRVHFDGSDKRVSL